MWNRFRTLLLLTGWVLLSACGSIISHTPEFFLLAAVEPDAVAAPSRVVLALKPVELPKYLDSSRIMTRRGANALEQAPNHLWAEPLQDNFSRVLALDLAQRTGTERVYSYPRQMPRQVRYVVTVNVTEFIGSFPDGVRLQAYWSLSDGDAKRVLYQHNADLRMMIKGNEYSDLVSTMSHCVSLLADQIAAEVVRRQAKTGP